MSKGSDLPEIFFATHNQHKSDEVGKMLRGLYVVSNLNDLDLQEKIPETGDTLEDNSRIKANFLNQLHSIDCFADDTGLEVEALDGAPGVRSARYAGEPKDDNRNIDLLLKNLDGSRNPNARFRTVLTVIIGGAEKQFEGIVAGRIITDKRGTNGFGYDPVFVPVGYDLTFAEMSSEEKNKISHRGEAIKKLIEYLTEISGK